MILAEIKQQTSKLSPKAQLIADFILKNYVDVAFMGIVELSNRAKVSSATITRFVHHFGFTSYTSFQKELQNLAKTEITPFKEFQSYVLDNSEQDFLMDQIQESKDALDMIYTEQLSKKIIDVANVMENARQIYILGSRSSFAIAYYMFFSLKRIKENIHLIENRNEDSSLNLQYISAEDLLIAISYPKYTEYTVHVLNFFNERGCKIVSITDRMTSPLAKNADYLLLVKNKLKIYFVTTITVINSLLLALGKINPKLNIDTFQEENEVTRKLAVYCDD